MLIVKERFLHLKLQSDTFVIKCLKGRSVIFLVILYFSAFVNTSDIFAKVFHYYVIGRKKQEKLTAPMKINISEKCDCSIF